MPSAQGELVPPWLRSLPLAPEFRPTAAEFADPVAYLLKIEPAAAPFGICKVVPPLPPPPKRTTLGNLSRSFAALHPGDPSPTFPTRHQQLGLCRRRPRPALKPVSIQAPEDMTNPSGRAQFQRPMRKSPYYLPSDGEAEAGGEGAAGGPAEEAEEGPERAGAAVEEEVVGAVDRGGDAGGVRERGGEVEQQERGEEDGPDEELMDAHVDGVAVVRAVEGVVPLQVQEAAAAARFRHRSPDPWVA